MVILHRSSILPFALGGMVAILGVIGPGPMAANLVPGGTAPSLVSDAVARRIGDSLNVQIFETASASNSAQGGTKRAARAGGQLNSGAAKPNSADLTYVGAFDGSGQSGRSDKIVAQISAVVVDILPNGDLRIAGDETLTVNGEVTRIHVRGRVRPQDIAPTNSVLSTRLADAQIEYSGAGVVSRSAQPGILVRLLNRVGLF